MIKLVAFLFVAIWLHLAHSWPGLKYMRKAKYKDLEIDKYIIYTLYYIYICALYIIFVHVFFFFVLVDISMSVSILGNR